MSPFGGMRVGVVLPMFSGDAGKVRDSARRAEALGFDGVFAFDHFVPPGRGAGDPSLEVFTTLSAIAMATDRVALGTLVTRVGVRNTGLIAKMAAQIDDLSGGRMILGMGAGDSWDDPEARTYDLPTLGEQVERRAQLADSARAIRSLFAGRAWEGSASVPAMRGPLLPPPLRSGGPPVWLGGISDEVVRLAAATADGWNGWGVSVKGFSRRARLLASSAKEAGRESAPEPTWAGIALVARDDAELEELLAKRAASGVQEGKLWSGTTEAFGTHFAALADAGATWAIVMVAGPADRYEVIGEVLAGARP